jgi:hypothetical protein
MYVRQVYKRLFSAIPEHVVSTDSTTFEYTMINSTTLSIFPGSTTRRYGQNYSITITATTGGLYILPSEYTAAPEEPTSDNSYHVDEGEAVTLRIPYMLSVKGDSTTASYKAAIWDDDR